MNTANIFFRSDHIDKQGYSTVYMCAYLNQKKHDFTLSIRVLPDNWDSKKKHTARL